MRHKLRLFPRLCPKYPAFRGESWVTPDLHEHMHIPSISKLQFRKYVMKSFLNTRYALRSQSPRSLPISPFQQRPTLVLYVSLVSKSQGHGSQLICFLFSFSKNSGSYFGSSKSTVVGILRTFVRTRVRAQDPTCLWASLSCAWTKTEIGGKNHGSTQSKKTWSRFSVPHTTFPPVREAQCLGVLHINIQSKAIAYLLLLSCFNSWSLSQAYMVLKNEVKRSQKIAEKNMLTAWQLP